MYQYELPRYLPTADELPNSDDTPVDEDWSRRFPPAKEVRNELQELIPGLLKSILRLLWQGRMDWFFGIDMGIYTHPEEQPIVPDGFLSLNVERSFDEDLRLSYLMWEEEVTPILVLEVVSAKPGGEYTTKLDKYAELGVLYYVIYSLEKVLHLGKPQDRTFRNPKRRRKARLEIHKLVNGNYELQTANPLWMPEIGLGIGSERANYDDLTREWLYWYDRDANRYPTPYERIELADRAIEQERQQTERERQRYLRHRRSCDSPLLTPNSQLSTIHSQLYMDITNLQTLIEAGSLEEATTLAENWRLSCIELQATIEQKLDDTRRDIYSVDWVEEMPNLLNGAMDRIERSRMAIVAAKDIVNSQFDILEDLHAQKFGSGRPRQEEYYQLGDLYKALEACYLAHVELLRPLIGARSVWLDEQVRQVFTAPVPEPIVNS